VLHRNYIDQHKVAIVCSARSGSTKDLGTTNLLLRASSEALQRRNKTAGTPGTTTPVTRGLFGAGRAGSDGSQSPPMSPQSRSRSSRSTSPQPIFGFTPINGDSQCTETLPKFHATVELLRQEHINAAQASIRDPEILFELQEEIDRDCEWLRSYLFAAKVCLVVHPIHYCSYLTTVTLCRLVKSFQIIDEISPRSKDNIIGLGEQMACKFMTAVLRDQVSFFLSCDLILTSI